MINSICDGKCMINDSNALPCHTTLSPYHYSSATIVYISNIEYHAYNVTISRRVTRQCVV